MLFIKRSSSSYQSIKFLTNTKKPGEKSGVQGWIQNIRRLKNHLFLDVNDGSVSSKFQVVIAKTEQNKDLTPGSSIRASGLVQTAPNGAYELHADELNVIGDGHLGDGYPFSPKQQHPPEYVRNFLHLRSRIDYMAAQMRVRHQAQKVLHDCMHELGFVHINTPILSTNDCEGAGEVFTARPASDDLLKEMARDEVPLQDGYFDERVYLSVSGQMHLEAMCYGLGNVYTLSPAFRAENCKSPLHLSEFYMYEAELAFVDDLAVLTAFIESMLKRITGQLLDSSGADLQHCQQRATGAPFTLPWLERQWQTLSHAEAQRIVQEHKQRFKTALTPDEGFSKEQELFLVAHCDSPLFIVDWPAAQKPFYMKASRRDPQLVHALDLLMPGVGELCGGSLREPDAGRLKAYRHLPPGLEWYVDLRRYGGVPTGGFGMGFERYLQLLTGVKNIRDVIPYPRYPHSCRM